MVDIDEMVERAATLCGLNGIQFPVTYIQKNCHEN